MLTEGDSTWFTYTSISPCGDLGISSGIITNPVLSSKPFEAFVRYNGVVSRDTLDTCSVTYTDGIDGYTWYIDKTRWIVVGIDILGKYNGRFLWGDFGGIPYLRKVYLQGDTTMAVGGYQFENVRINGTMVPQTAIRSYPGKQDRHQATAVPWNSTMGLFDLRGRMVGRIGYSGSMLTKATPAGIFVLRAPAVRKIFVP